jgi:rhamnosyltransferase
MVGLDCDEERHLNHACGVIVTFNPDAKVLLNIAQILPQLDWLVVVDNGSRPEALKPIQDAASSIGFKLIENGANLGIATALNKGVEWARSQNAAFVALFDQDSTAADGLIDALVQTYKERSVDRRVAIVSAKHMHEDTRTWLKPVFDPDGGPLVAITSGSLLPLTIFDECGLFEDDFIIDRVDEEHCLRVRSRGYSIVLCEAGILWVTLGSPNPFRILGMTLRATHYSPGRRYYITRNRMVIVKRYWRLYPQWCYWAVSGFLKELLYVCLAEKRKLLKLRNMGRGLWDALIGRMGMVIPL